MNNKKELNEKGNLKPIPLLLSGGALFAMHFGASSMVWPMNWGKESGSSLFIAFLGAFITSLLLVIVGYIALARFNNTYSNMAKTVAGPKFGVFFTSFTILIIGPFYAIPRMSAASWDAFTQVFGLDNSSKIPIIFFMVSFYIITYIFLLSPGKALGRISKFLFPVLIIIVVAIISKGIISPIGEINPKTYTISPFAYGFTNGYATAEVICALIFGSVIFNGLKEKGIGEEKLTANLIRVSICGISILSVTHFCHMVIGATASQIFPNLSYTKLYTAVAVKLYGNLGGMFFCGALLMAALTTAIGMTSGCAEFFVDISNNRIEYKKISLVIIILSIIFGSFGLTDILTFLGPLLDGVYPSVIVLVLYFALVRNFENPSLLISEKWAFYSAFTFGVLDMLWKYSKLLNLGNNMIFDLYTKIPLSECSLLWMPITILTFVVRFLFSRKLYKQNS